jgi:RNA polymerase sigma-70 factor (ECF subfamily)
MCPELFDVIRRAQSGDLAAQAELVRRYTKRISAFVRPMVGHLGALEDVVQTVFIKLARRIGNLRDPLMYESWLFTLARNTSLDFIRRSRCRPATIPEDGIFNQTPDYDSGVSVPEIMEALNFALLRVSPTDRRIVTMIVQGSSYHAAAKCEGLSVGAVKLRLNRVRPLLRLIVGEAIGRQARRVETVRAAPRCRAAA